VYNLINDKPALWNPLCANPSCKTEVKFSGNFLKGYKKYCCVKCSANDLDTKTRRALTNLKKYGCVNAAASSVVKEKIAKTFKENDSYAKAETSRKKTLLARTDGRCSNVSQLPGVQLKVVETNLVRYGVAHANQKDANRKAQSNRMKFDGSKQSLKGRATILKEHGVDNPMKIPGVVAAMEDRHFQKYGVRHNMHRPDILAKAHRSLHRSSDFNFKGKTFRVQGYEREQIEYLCEIGFNVNSLSQDFEPIEYFVARKSHMYYPDLVIEKGRTQLVVETKSPYTAWSTGHRLRLEVLRKARAAVKARQNFVLLVFGNKGDSSPVGFYLVKHNAPNFRKLRYSTKVESLPRLLRVFM
jgi:hypothetical protein